MPAVTESDPPLSRTGITLRELEVLRVLVTTGTATAAADRLGISQPAVSRSIAQIEARLGRRLFLREGGRLLPTADAHAIDAELDAVQAALSRIENAAGPQPDPDQPLRLAVPPTIGHRFLPGPVAEFARRHPRQQIIIDVLSSDVLATQVAEGRVDLGITDTTLNHAGIRQEPFHDSALVCLMPRDHPLAARATITPADLHGVDFITQTRRHSVRAAKDGMLMAASAQPHDRIETATVVLAAELVREGLGVALINPFPTALRLDPSLCLRPFRPKITLRTCFLTPTGARPSAAALAFMDIARAHASQISFDGAPDDQPDPQPVPTTATADR